MDNFLNWTPTEVEKKVKKSVESIVWVKVIALGDSGCGKTCLIKHFCESKFSQCYHATVGVDYGFKVQTVKGLPLRVHLWDLSGDNQYYDVRTELYSGTDACFLVFDVTDRSTFESLETWFRELGKFGTSNASIYVVGNKADLRANKNCVSMAEARKWSSSHKLPYYETSALSGANVLKMFNELLSAVVTSKKLNSVRPSTTA